MKSILAAGLAAVASLGFAQAGYAQGATPGATHDPSSVKGGSYVVEPSHTQITFTLMHLGFSYYSGVFSNASGTLSINLAKPAQDKLSITVPIDSVMTTSTKLDGELKGDQWFDAAKYPTASFVSTKVVPEGKDSARITGTLTLHGVSRPETLIAHFVGAGTNPLDKKYTIGFEATGSIRRSDYGVKTYVPLVGDDVKLTIAGAFEQPG